MDKAERQRCLQEAVRSLRDGKAQAAFELFTRVLVGSKGVVLPDAHTLFCNRAAALLKLGRSDEAVQDALQALRIIETGAAGVPLRRCHGYTSALRRLGDGLAASGLLQLAQDAYEEGLASDPHHLGLRQGLQAVIKANHNTTQQPVNSCDQRLRSTGDQRSQQYINGSDLKLRGTSPDTDDQSSEQQTESDGHRAETAHSAVTYESMAVQVTQSDGVTSSEPMAVQAVHPHGPELLPLVALQLPHLPVVRKQLSAKQAAVDVVTRDTLNYLTIQSDIQVPRQLLSSYLQDPVRMRALEAAISAAVDDITRGQGLECRVLVVGGAMGVLPLLALRAGAAHVTVVERWLYASLACKELLHHHHVPPEQYHVLHGCMTDMRLGRDVPVCANLVVADALLDDGVFTSGLTSCVRHALSHLVTPDVTLIPQGLQIWCQAVEVQTPACGNTTLSALDSLRPQSFPGLAGSGDRRLLPGLTRRLSAPVPCWTLDCHNMPDKPEARLLDVVIEQGGTLTSVLCWYDVQLYRNIRMTSYHPSVLRDSCTAVPPLLHQPGAPCATSLQPVLHTLPSVVVVKAGERVGVVAAHNTARLAFVLEGPRTLTPGPAPGVEDVSVPRKHLVMVADHTRLGCFQEAIRRAVQQLTQQPQGSGGIHVLDATCAGSGTLGIMAASCDGVTGVTCVESHPSLAVVARRSAALNGVSDKVCVVHGCMGDVVRGVHVPSSGVHMVLMDAWDETLLGMGALGALDSAIRQGLVSHDTKVLPTRAVLYCMGVQIMARHPAGSTLDSLGSSEQHLGPGGRLLDQVDLTPLDKYWYTDVPQPVVLADLPHKRLTPAFPLYEVDFQALVAGEPQPIRPARPASTTLGMVAGDPKPIRSAQAQSQGTAVGSSDTSTAAPGVEYFVREGRGGGLMLQAAATGDGVINAVVMWQELHLDDHVILTTAPHGIGPRGAVQPEAVHPAAVQVDAVQPGTAHSESAQPEAAQAGAGRQGSHNNAWDGSRSPRSACDPCDVQMESCAQVVQFTDHVMVVKANQPVQLVVQRQGPKVLVDVRPTRGTPATRPPWKEEWGGGSSIENPHVQRVKYCDLLESDLMQRLPCGRGPSVEQDIRALAGHCGTLMLHGPAVTDSLQHLSLLERLYRPGSTHVNLGANLAASPKADDRWAFAILSEQKRLRQPPQRTDDCGADVGRGDGVAGVGESAGARVRFPPEVVPSVHWKQVEGCRAVFLA